MAELSNKVFATFAILVVVAGGFGGLLYSGRLAFERTTTQTQTQSVYVSVTQYYPTTLTIFQTLTQQTASAKLMERATLVSYDWTDRCYLKFDLQNAGNVSITVVSVQVGGAGVVVGVAESSIISVSQILGYAIPTCGQAFTRNEPYTLKVVSATGNAFAYSPVYLYLLCRYDSCPSS